MEMNITIGVIMDEPCLRDEVLELHDLLLIFKYHMQNLIVGEGEFVCLSQYGSQDLSLALPVLVHDVIPFNCVG